MSKHKLPFTISYFLFYYPPKLNCIGEDIKATVLFLGLLTMVLTCRYLWGFGLPIDGIIS